LVMPAIVALVATNFEKVDRPKAYGMVAVGGAVAVAVGPLIGGLFTTYWSWRYVFVGEVLILGVVLLLNRRTADTPAEEGAALDPVGTALSALGFGLIVYGVLRMGTWGFAQPKPGAPTWLGLSPVVWLVLGGGAVLVGFLAWERHRRETAQPALLDPVILRVRLLRKGLVSFFFQYLLQAGLFFAVPLYLSIALGLSAIDTGVRILPLSVTLVIAAIGIPKVFPLASPRRVCQLGFFALFLGLVVFVAALEAGAGPEIVTWPMLLAGLGIGMLASQLGAVTVSALPDEQSGEVGGLQNTFSNLGISIGTALAGAVLMSALTASFLTGVEGNPDVPEDLSSEAQTELTSGVPFISDADLDAALEEVGVTGATAEAIIDENAEARLDGLRTALSVLAVLAILALLFSGSLPTAPVGAPHEEETAAA
jgi:predicted MFS family arabinose efflux permease